MTQTGNPIRCVAVRSPRGTTVTEIDWADGHKSSYPHAILRGYCPCATCQGHEEGVRFVDASGIQLEVQEIRPVGNYALRFEWFDGHATGLYSFRYLRALCQCSACAPGSPIAAHAELPRI